ncbi:hypothetical protein [Streptomyces sp. NPDC052015]|uniref:hypothetical protein n=1 Tax=Streptomyces sp. NPDC052015 TaxID=3154755 RepID=UPI00342434C1
MGWNPLTPKMPKPDSPAATSPGTNPRTSRPIRSESEMWTSLAKDADHRAAQADSKQGRKAMEKNARDFRRNARRTR